MGQIPSKGRLGVVKESMNNEWIRQDLFVFLFNISLFKKLQIAILKVVRIYAMRILPNTDIK